MSRALRTSLVQKPRTLGERIRFARITINLSQEQFGKAISQISKAKVSKSLVSKWEVGGVDNPNNANMLAMQAVTGFSIEWLVNGRGPQRMALPTAAASNGATDPDRLAKALTAATSGGLLDVREVARIAAKLYDLLGDTPEISAPILERFGASLRE